MNIKSLILGSAAALVAAPAMAADLPVAEPVDYVKVCGAYGAGYFFIPGTDNCLKISGNVEFGAEIDDRRERITRTTGTNLYTDINVTFDAKRETELGTLSAHIEMDAGDIASGTTSVVVDKAYIQLDGFYAGVTDSIINYNAGVWYDDHSFDGGDINVVGYAAPLGNGVTLTVAVEEAYAPVSATGVAGTAAWTFPRLAAEIAVAQGWGSVEIGAAVHQIRYNNPLIDADFGFAVGGEASVDLMEGLTFGIAGGYVKGNSANFVSVTGTSTKLFGMWSASAALTYAATDKLTVGIDGGITDQTDSPVAAQDYRDWTVSGGFDYVVVDNLTLTGEVGYNKRDFDAAGTRDLDGWVGALRIVRDF